MKNFFFLSSVTNWWNKYINVLSHYLTSVALCFSDSKKGQWRPDSPSAVYQWKSNIVHKQGSGNQYFITKLLVRMKKNSRRFFGSLLGPGCCEFNVRIGVTRAEAGWVREAWAGELELRHSSCKQNNNNSYCYQVSNHDSRFYWICTFINRNFWKRVSFALCCPPIGSQKGKDTEVWIKKPQILTSVTVRGFVGKLQLMLLPGPQSVLLCISAFPSCWLNLGNIMSFLLLPAKNML